MRTSWFNNLHAWNFEWLRWCVVMCPHWKRNGSWISRKPERRGRLRGHLQAWKRKKQGHLCTPQYEEAKCKPHTLMTITGTAVWYRKRCQQRWQKPEGTPLTASKEGGIYPDLWDSLSLTRLAVCCRAVCHGQGYSREQSSNGLSDILSLFKVSGQNATRLKKVNTHLQPINHL